MKIKQVVCLSKIFRTALAQKYGLQAYTDVNEPLLIFGLTKGSYTRLIGHKSLCVIVFTGGDSMNLYANDVILNLIKGNKDVHCIALSDIISRDLFQAGIEHKVIPINPFVNNINPQPFGDKIYSYIPQSLRGFYGGYIVDRLKELIPHEILTCSLGSYKREQLIKEIYPQCFIGLRLTAHDGLPNTAIELALCGRKTVTNVDMPCSLKYSGLNDIVKHIRTESKLIGTAPDNTIPDLMKKFLNVGEDWLMTENYNFITREERAIKRLEALDCKPLISVIINTINEREDYLTAAIDSYLNQERIEVQLIISTIAEDSSIKVAERYGDKVEVRVSETKGIYEQLNNAIMFVKGEYFTILSGNDVACKDKLWNEYYSCIEQCKLICYSNYYKCDKDLNIGKTIKFKEYSITDHLQGNMVNDGALVHSSLLKHLPFDTEWGNHAFYDYWLRIYKKLGNVFAFNPVPAFYYRVNKHSNHIKRKYNADEKQDNKDKVQKLLEHHKKLIHQPIVLGSHNPNETHFVFPYRADGAVWKELFIAIRSIMKFYQGRYKIFIIGDKPSIRSHSVVHVPYARQTGKGSKIKDQINKLKYICSLKFINNDFVYMYDDMCLAKNCKLSIFQKVVAQNQVPDPARYHFSSKPQRGWFNYFINTFTHLKAKGLPCYNYETHLPKMLNKANVSRIIQDYNLDINNYLFHSIYFNTLHKKPHLLLDNDSQFKCSLMQSKGENYIKIHTKNKFFINYNNAGLNDGLREFLLKLIK